MANVRVRPASQGGTCAVRHPEHGELVVPNPAEVFDASDPLVREYPWLFRRDDEVSAADEHTVAESTPVIERGTRAPGERRPRLGGSRER